MKARIVAVSAILIGITALPAAAQTLTVSVTGLGRITGTGIACPTDCREDFLPTRIGAGPRPATSPSIVLTANKPTSWGGACAGTSGLTCAVSIVPGGVSVSAAFPTTVTLPDIPKQGLQVQIKGDGKVTGTGIDCPPDCYEPGTTVRVLTATPEPGGSFLGWGGGVPGGDCSGTGPTCTSGGVSGPSVVWASFSAMLTVAIQGGGRVTSVKIDCPGDCQEAYAAGSSVTLTASSNSGYAFAGWGGDCAAAGTAPTCTMKMGTRNSVTAQFLPSAIRLPGRP